MSILLNSLWRSWKAFCWTFNTTRKLVLCLISDWSWSKVSARLISKTAGQISGPTLYMLFHRKTLHLKIVWVKDLKRWAFLDHHLYLCKLVKQDQEFVLTMLKNTNINTFIVNKCCWMHPVKVSLKTHNAELTHVAVLSALLQPFSASLWNKRTNETKTFLWLKSSPWTPQSQLASFRLMDSSHALASFRGRASV